MSVHNIIRFLTCYASISSSNRFWIPFTYARKSRTGVAGSGVHGARR